jgi:hypothetical protein
MSADACERCGLPVESDDPANWRPVSATESAPFCEDCREGDDYTEDQRLDDPRHGQASDINRSNAR